MMSGYVYRAPTPHRCVPGGFMVADRVLTLGNVGDVWLCDCGRRWCLEESWFGSREWVQL